MLPSKVKTAVETFNETLLAISAPTEEVRTGTAAAFLDRSADPREEVTRAYARAINCIRHHLAIDSLTTGMLKEMGIGSESVPVKTFRSGVNPLVPVGRTVP